ncbi:hypothetical protein ABG79_02192 [Caloramator mitchellensis]|uniref:Uncharacterized protein n=1 Tax=Caloramator mitchellensis TaxID=908809 RepID=A0A0R3JYM9_CALMK|nr:hypothetical protein ABG79_02192 [Caloramator mitchellensis]
MSVLKINGADVPAPSSLIVGIMDISKAERNAQGTMIIERIATKRKLELSWSYLTKDELSNLLNKVSPVFFEVTYTDPQTGVLRTGTFYCGDRSVGMMDYNNGNIRWKDIKFNLIER